MKKGNKGLHILDRYLGIPIVIILGLFKIKKRFKNSNEITVDKIGFLNLGSIGDTVLLFGIIKDMREKFPIADITFFAGSSNYATAQLCPEVNKVVKINSGNPFKIIKTINAEDKFDIFFDCMPWPRISAIITYFSKSFLKVGYKTPGQYRHYIYDVIGDHLESLHELENTRNLIKWLDIKKFNFPLLRSEALYMNNKDVIIHMFPSGINSYLKMWPDESWAIVIKYLEIKGFNNIYITGGKDDRLEAESFLKGHNFKNVINVAGQLKINETVELINSVNLVISVNTGIMHLAACSQVNLIGLHGPTSAERWGPVNSNSISINSPHPNAPCLHLGSEYSCGNINCTCMAMISADEVISKIELFEF